jgi:aspartate/methionine/tyrosine aminotransferase
MMQLAQRMERLGTETAFEVLARAKALEAEGRDIIHLEVGEPDFDTPANISEAAIKALRDGHTHYGPAPGMLELRQTIAEAIGKTRNIHVEPDQVVVTPGAKPIMFFSILALVNEGDEVIYPNPGFPIYESVIDFVGAKSVPLPLKEEKEFSFDINDLKQLITPRTKMIILNSPQNPTGGVLSREDLEGIAELVRGTGIKILTDEVYEFIIYDGEHVSIASLPGMQEQSIILHGFSKTYAMTGWRLGFGVMPKLLAEQVTKLQINSNSCPNGFVQFGGLEALRGPQDEARAMVEEFRRRQDVIVDGLNAIDGVTCLRPRGAFYVFPNVQGLIEKTGMSTRKLASFLLEEAGVAALSGTAFGRFGEGYMRFSYANSVENIRRALERIETHLKNRL